MKKILVINGPNLNMLGLREPELYGARNFDALQKFILECADEMGLSVELFQSNHEGVIVDKIQAAYKVFDAILINPAAYTHTSVAIRDALAAVKIPAVEVHLSNVSSRDEFRNRSLTAPVCRGVIAGFGAQGYRLALQALLEKW